MADIKNTFSKGLTVLNVKTANFLELNKIKTYITTLTGEIAALKSEIGNEVYDKWAADEPLMTESLIQKLQLVKEKTEIIRQQEEEAARLTEKEKQILGEQEARAQAAAVQSQTHPQPEEPVFTCPNCGQFYEQPYRFCKKCGTRLN